MGIVAMLLSIKLKVQVGLQGVPVHSRGNRLLMILFRHGIFILLLPYVVHIDDMQASMKSLLNEFIQAWHIHSLPPHHPIPPALVNLSCGATMWVGSHG